MADPGSAVYFEVVSRWADDLAHEIKNPLHAMVINLELVKQRAERGQGEGAIERAKIVELELARVHTLLDSFLNLVRPWPGQAPTRVDRVLEALVPAFEARCRVRKVDYRHVAEPVAASVSPADLVRALVILGDRAIDALPDGGSLDTTVTTDGDGIEIAVEHAGQPGAEPSAESPTGEDPRVHEARKLIERAGGSLDLEGPPAGGRATIRLRSASTEAG